MTAAKSIAAPPPPTVRVCIGVTGHRAGHPLIRRNRARIADTMASICARIDVSVAAMQPLPAIGAVAPTRLCSLLADGFDQMAAEMALARGWELVSPLPFGRRLNEAINAHPRDALDARALLNGDDPADADTRARAYAIRALAERAHLFELAEADEKIAALLLAQFDAEEASFLPQASVRVAAANRLVIEQSDFILAVWDGVTTAPVGGTGHTVAAALDAGAPVVWIDPAAPERWCILRDRESLAQLPAMTLGTPGGADALATMVTAILRPEGDGAGVEAVLKERWRAHSNPLWHAYRRVEALFDRAPGRGRYRSLRRHYETPDEIVTGSGAALLATAGALPGGDPTFPNRIESGVLRRFAWSDGVSAHLSDTYRGGMVANFALSALAVVAGIAYLPFGVSDDWGLFAAAEFALLATILVIAGLGSRLAWHTRWFETRRLAEYLRHSPFMLLLGVARAPGRWPKGKTTWPEWFALHSLREVGLPRVVIGKAYLRAALQALLDSHIAQQRDYHRDKARRLTAVHNNLDRVSLSLFALAVVSVATFVVLKVTSSFWTPAGGALEAATPVFTLFGVLLPTFGASVSGIRFFGDFERFAAISEVTAERLDAVHRRIDLLLSSEDTELTFAMAADLAHAADDVVVSEIESWQAVFGGKHVTVPA